MRNLKKVLSLALALVMLLGMMMIGAGAATTKADLSEANQEAVAVLKATKVMTSKEYDRPVTRAEAAKMVLTIYSPVLAKGVKNTKDSAYFTSDVKNHWAAGYIDLCFSLGIISGRSKTVFDPNGTVKGYELAKMVLIAMGKEGKYTGNTWTSNVTKAATEVGLGTNTKISNDPMTRLEAAQLVFNGLTKSVSGTTGYVLMNGENPVEAYKDVVFSTINDAVMAKLAANNTTWTVKPSIASDSLISKNFPDLKKTTKDDGLGHQISVWNAGTKEVWAAAGAAETPVKTYTKAVAPGTVGRDFPATGANAYTYADGLKYLENGVEKTVIDEASDIQALIANGKTVEVYASNRTITKVIVIAKTFAKLAADPVVASNGNITVSSITGLANVKPENLKVTGGDALAKGDVVLYLKDSKNVWQVEKLAPAFTGKVTGNNAQNGALINGAYYQATGLSANVGSTKYTGPITDDKEYNFYLDDAGCIVYAEAVTDGTPAASNYAVVLQTSWVVGHSTGVIGETGTKGYLQAKILKTDGTTEVATVASVDGATPVAAGTQLTALGHTTSQFAKSDATLSNVVSSGNLNTGSAITATTGSGQSVTPGTATVADQFTGVADSASGEVKALYLGVTDTAGVASGKAPANAFYTYSVNSKGEYVLSSAAATGDTLAALASHSLENGKVLFDGTSIGSAGTVFLYEITTGNNVEYKVYTGIANAPTVTYANDATNKLTNAGASNVIVKTGSVAKLVFVRTTGTTSSTPVDVIYVLSGNKTQLNTNPITYTYDAVVNGTVTTITTEVSNASAGFYTGNANDKGVYTALSSATPKTGIVSNADGVLIADVSSPVAYGYKAGTPAYIISGDASTQTVVESLALDATDLVNVVPNADGTAAVVYVVTKDSKPSAVTVSTTDATEVSISTSGDLLASTPAVVTEASGKHANGKSIKVTATAKTGTTCTVSIDNGVAVAGGTGATYTLATGDAKTVTVTVTVTDTYSNIVDSYDFTLSIGAITAAD